MLKRLELSIEYFANITSPTRGNWSQSMIKAGYKEAYAAKKGWLLMDKEGVRAKIETVYQDSLNITQKSREEKRALAWNNYVQAKTDRDKQFWWQEVCKLDGDYIIKQEITTEDKTKRELEHVRQEVNRLAQTN